MKYTVLFLLFFGFVLPAGELDLAFGENGTDWQLVRARFNAAERRVEFRRGSGSYYHVARTVPAKLEQGGTVTVSAEIELDDPSGRDAKHTQLRLIFLDAERKNVFADGEDGRAVTLRHTGGKRETFSCSYRIPENARFLNVRVKSQVPVMMNVYGIRASVTEPSAAEGVPFTIRSIAPESVANYSFLNHKPAGKFGWAAVRNGDFVFPNGEKVRWFGINLVASRVFDWKTEEEADAFAAKLAALGINMVRLHHLAPGWQNSEPLFVDGKKSTLEFSDKALKKLDYLLEALKKQGIYVTNEIVDASLRPAEGEIPYTSKGKSIHQIKLLMMIDPDVKAYVKRWIRGFYCRPNRYTGIPLIRDPQLACLGIVNEISIGYHNGALVRNLPERAKEILNRKFREDRARRKLPERQFDFELREPESARYFHDLLRTAFAEWKQFVRELGYKGLISGSNFGENFYHHSASAGPEMDFMDAHLYWGFAGYMDGVDAKTRILPGNRWNDLVKPPYNEKSYTKELFARFSMSSTPDMPLVSSEHRTSISDFRRSAFRTAGLPFFSTVHAFQEWDGFYIFASQGGNGNRIGHRLDVKYDTAYLATFPLSAYLLRGGVIRPAEKTVVYRLSEEDVFRKPRALSFLHDGLFSVPEQHKLRLLYPGMKDIPGAVPFAGAGRLPRYTKETIGGDTGEFVRNWKKGYFVIRTAKVQGAEGFFEPGELFELPDAVLRMNSPFGVCFLSAGGSDSIRTAPRLLFTAVNSSINSGNIGEKKKGWSLPGTAPVRILPVRGELNLKNGCWSVWTLDEHGKRSRRVAQGISGFEFDTIRDRTVWYELCRE